MPRRRILHCCPVTVISSCAANAADADPSVPAAQRRPPQTGGGRGPGRAQAKVSGEESGGRHALPAKEESVGYVSRKKSGGAHPNQHATPGKSTGECSRSSPQMKWGHTLRCISHRASYFTLH